MSFWHRLKLVLASNVNALVSKAEDPEKILEQLIVEMRSQYREAKMRVAAAIADEKRLAAQLEKEQSSSGEWEEKAKLALNSGNEDLAKKALLRKKEIDDRVAEFDRQWGQQKKATEALKVALKKLNDKIEEARRQKDVLIARHKRAVAQKEIQDTMAGIGDSSTFDTFNRMSDKVEHAEAHAEASLELAEFADGDTLEDEFKALEEGELGDKLLADFMAKVEAEEPAQDSVDADLDRLKALMAGTTGPTIDVEVEGSVDS